jgi:hypothetical protein
VNRKSSNYENRITELKEALVKESSDSLSLLQDIESNPICSVKFDNSIPCIAVEWRQYATSTQIRFILENIIGLLKQHGVSRILGNDSALPVVHTEDQEWIANDWFPRAVAAGWRVSANKLPDSYFGQLTTNQVQSEAPEAVVIRNFQDLSDARQWLKAFPGP